ncbi:MAG: sulfatase [Reichenbachiella sp.]|uniref:sulfatase n=1 Tax=Reichenbachiella sp. TaxID=2184521 RepID=UPI003297AD4F
MRKINRFLSLRFNTKKVLLRFFILILLITNFDVVEGQNKGNVLFIIVDDLQPMISSYGAEFVSTPNMDSLSKESIQFNSAFCTYPLCSPSRASVLTGKRFRFQNHTNDEEGPSTPSINEVIRENKSLGELFKKNGYFTAALGKVYHGHVPEPDVPYWDLIYDSDSKKRSMEEWSTMTKENRGGRSDHIWKIGNKLKPAGALVWGHLDVKDDYFSDGEAANKACEIISSHKKKDPLFLTLGFRRPHLPLFAPSKYFDQLSDENYPVFASHDRSLRPFDITPKNKGLWNEGMSDKESQEVIKAYNACVSYVDNLIGKVIDELKKAGMYDNTTIILWGDNGFHLSDHGLFRKNTPWQVSNRVPLMIHSSAQKTKGEYNGVVEAVDIYPTLVDLLDLKTDMKKTEFDGKSLVPIIQGNLEKDHKEFAMITAKTRIGIVDRKHYFLLDSVSAEIELYDRMEDPSQLKNLADSSLYDDTKNDYINKVKAAWENVPWRFSKQ